MSPSPPRCARLRWSSAGLGPAWPTAGAVVCGGLGPALPTAGAVVCGALGPAWPTAGAVVCGALGPAWPTAGAVVCGALGPAWPTAGGFACGAACGDCCGLPGLATPAFCVCAYAPGSAAPMMDPTAIAISVVRFM